MIINGEKIMEKLWNDTNEYLRHTRRETYHYLVEPLKDDFRAVRLVALSWHSICVKNRDDPGFLTCRGLIIPPLLISKRLSLDVDIYMDCHRKLLSSGIFRQLSNGPIYSARVIALLSRGFDSDVIEAELQHELKCIKEE